VERLSGLQGTDDLDAEDVGDLQAGVVVRVAGCRQAVVGAPRLGRIVALDLTVHGIPDQPVQLRVELRLVRLDRLDRLVRIIQRARILHSDALPRRRFAGRVQTFPVSVKRKGEGSLGERLSGKPGDDAERDVCAA